MHMQACVCVCICVHVDVSSITVQIQSVAFGRLAEAMVEVVLGYWRGFGYIVH